jgi:outer membrane lipoprotein-sorting protein
MRTQNRASVHPTFVAFVRSRNIVALAFAVALPVAGQSPALNDAFARLDKTAQLFKAVSADIRRDMYTAVIDEHEKDMGTIAARREKSHETRMLIAFTGPDAKTISIDRTFVRVYLPKSKVVQVYDLGARRSIVDQFLLLGFGASSAELKEDYEVTLIGNGKETLGTANTWHLQLIPKSKDVLQHLKKAELWIDETTGLPAQQKFVTSSTGDFSLFTYSNTVLNPSLPDSALKLTYPRGVTEEHPRL